MVIYSLSCSNDILHDIITRMVEKKKILLRMPNWVGDFVMATPVIQDLTDAFPEAKLDILCRKPLSQLILRDSRINQFYEFQKPLTRNSYQALIQYLRKQCYDIGVLLTNSFSSALEFWNGNVVQRIGYSGNFRAPFLTDAISRPKEKKEHQVLYYKNLLVPLGIQRSTTKPFLVFTEKERREALWMLYEKGYEAETPLIGINATAAYGPAKEWPKESFREVAKQLQEMGFFIVFFGDHSSQEKIKWITKNLRKNVINLAGLTTLRQLGSFIKLCSVFLTNDSGPMHIAAALNIPLIALFGSTNDQITGPYQTGTIINKRVSCSPCMRRECPIDFRCMKQISVDEVVKKIIFHLKAYF